MGLYDRDYTQEKDQYDSQYARQMRMGPSPLTPAVKGLLIANLAVYLLGIIITGPNQESGPSFFEKIFALMPISIPMTLQLWRLVTYQFLHGSFGHIFVNMLGLFFFGPALEKFWGSRKFLFFYLTCGIAGGLFYILLVYVGFLQAGIMIGASGSILGVVTACAILFPQIKVFLYFIPLPIPIRVMAVFMIGYSVFIVLTKGANAGGEAAHLAGIAVGGLYAVSDSWRTQLKLRLKAFRWEKNIESERRLRIELDRILKKVHDSGLHSLTASEKRILKKATKFEQSSTR
jgi:membrane associated rhomboid family serine protease